ncbi:hypothetical protein DFP73DRAFT_531644 [Morchella snyderi]|nr:hypothetical protein DFP73DRAFT_531644 [Morchella snyderi]
MGLWESCVSVSRRSGVTAWHFPRILSSSTGEERMGQQIAWLGAELDRVRSEKAETERLMRGVESSVEEVVRLVAEKERVEPERESVRVRACLGGSAHGSGLNAYWKQKKEEEVNIDLESSVQDTKRLRVELEWMTGEKVKLVAETEKQCRGRGSQE